VGSAEDPLRTWFLAHVRSKPLLDGVLAIEAQPLVHKQVELAEAFPSVSEVDLETARSRARQLLAMADEWGQAGHDAMREGRDAEERFKTALERQFEITFPDFTRDSLSTVYSVGLRTNR
jgi:hypothetical protein